MSLREFRDALDRVAQSRVDPAVVRHAVADAYARAVLAELGDSVAGVVDEWVIETDRERLIDEARD